MKVDALPRDGLTQTFSAAAAERAALAERFGLVGIDELTADFTLKPTGRGVRVTGVVRARAIQTCVVSLEPFAAEVEEEVDVRFAPPPSEPSKGRSAEEILHFDDEDEPDPIVEGKIDLGALAAEFLALGLDPYPRKPGVEFEAPSEGEDLDDSPFAALSRVKLGARRRLSEVEAAGASRTPLP